MNHVRVARASPVLEAASCWGGIGRAQGAPACQVRAHRHEVRISRVEMISRVEVQGAAGAGRDLKEVAHMPATGILERKVVKFVTNAASHPALPCAQKTSTDRLEGALREGEALRVEINALRQNLDKAEGDKTRVRALQPSVVQQEMAHALGDILISARVCLPMPGACPGGN